MSTRLVDAAELGVGWHKAGSRFFVSNAPVIPCFKCGISVRGNVLNVPYVNAADAALLEASIVWMRDTNRVFDLLKRELRTIGWVGKPPAVTFLPRPSAIGSARQLRVAFLEAHIYHVDYIVEASGYMGWFDFTGPRLTPAVTKAMRAAVLRFS